MTILYLTTRKDLHSTWKPELFELQIKNCYPSVFFCVQNEAFFISNSFLIYLILYAGISWVVETHATSCKGVCSFLHSDHSKIH
jgi:hypothetical protein